MSKQMSKADLIEDYKSKLDENQCRFETEVFFSGTLSEVLSKLNMIGKEIAYAGNISDSCLSNWKSGKRTPDIEDFIVFTKSLPLEPIDRETLILALRAQKLSEDVCKYIKFVKDELSQNLANNPAYTTEKITEWYQEHFLRIKDIANSCGLSLSQAEELELPREESPSIELEPPATQEMTILEIEKEPREINDNSAVVIGHLAANPMASFIVSRVGIIAAIVGFKIARQLVAR